MNKLMDIVGVIVIGLVGVAVACIITITIISYVDEQRLAKQIYQAQANELLEGS